jgi:hypothetical protein
LSSLSLSFNLFFFKVSALSYTALGEIADELEFLLEVLIGEELVDAESTRAFEVIPSYIERIFEEIAIMLVLDVG